MRGTDYKVNKFLKLRLEGDKTYIYVKNQRFRQCMYLLMNIDVNKVEKYDMINSIDEAAENLDRTMEGNDSVRREITPKVEFWGHCSNIQAWAENDYDTRLLHRNLAFPLLKRLMLAGDPVAKRVFKEEIAIRLTSKHPTVVSYLLHQGYLKYLNRNELETIFDDLHLPLLAQTANSINQILEREQISRRGIQHILQQFFKNIGTNHIPFIFSKLKIYISPQYHQEVATTILAIFENRKDFSKIEFINDNIEILDVKKYNLVSYEKEIIAIFKLGEKLSVRNRKIEDLGKITGLNKFYDKIQILDLSNNLLTNLKGIEKFTSLHTLVLDNNLLVNIQHLEKLQNLEHLSLKNNKLYTIEHLDRFPNLKSVNLSGNKQITEIPKVLNILPTLQEIKLWNCGINKYDEATSLIFWKNQNYRFFKGFTPEEIECYEKTHSSKALSPIDGGFYKRFAEWVIKTRRKLKSTNVTYQDLIKFYTSHPTGKAFQAGHLTTRFKKFMLISKNQKITDFF